MSATGERNLVGRIAATDPVRALRIARGIRDPWFRCQALSFVAEYTKDPKARDALVQEAFRAAKEQTEPNRIVTVSAWPLGVLARTGRRPELERQVDRLLRIIAPEPHPIRNADALAELLVALQGVPPMYRKVLDAYRAAIDPARGWKRDWSLRNVAVMTHPIDPAAARELVEMIRTPQRQRQALREMENAETRTTL